MDLADAHVLTLEYLLDNEPNIIKLNLGNGVGVSVLELVHTFEEVNKIKIPFEFKGRRDGDVSRLVADSKLSKKMLSWEPKKNLSDMCSDGWRWQRLNPNGYS